MTTSQPILLGAFLLAVLPPGSRAEERNVDGIMDNSFFIEEAYNQEAGVVQHIWTGYGSVNRLSGADENAWDFTFTQEWPVGSQKHQLGFTAPYSYLESEGESDHGIGDLLLNYRYQAYFDEKSLRAFAPRFSLVLPTGNEPFGDESLGYQINLPFSTAIGDQWFVHANAGVTWLPDAGSADDRDLADGKIGGSVIYAATRDLHFVVEWIGEWKDEGAEHEFESMISPGLRKAFDFPDESQLVVGIAAPIGLTDAGPDFGVFLYCSFEHFFRRQK